MNTQQRAGLSQDAFGRLLRTIVMVLLVASVLWLFQPAQPGAQPVAFRPQPEVGLEPIFANPADAALEDLALLLTHLRDGPPFPNEVILGRRLVQDITQVIAIEQTEKEPRRSQRLRLRNQDGQHVVLWIEWRQIEGGLYTRIRKPA